MKKILIIVLILLAGLLFLGYRGSEQKRAETNLLLEDSGYYLTRRGLIEKDNFSFKKPSNWHLNFQEGVLEIYSQDKLYQVEEGCPEIREGCSIFVKTNDEQLEKKKLISDIKMALEDEELAESIDYVYDILNVSGFEAVKQFVDYSQELGSLYILFVPTEEKNYVFSAILEEDCEKTFNQFITTIKIDL